MRWPLRSCRGPRRSFAAAFVAIPSCSPASFAGCRRPAARSFLPSTSTSSPRWTASSMVPADRGHTSAAIEQGHLRAMQTADFVWLHCPGGYVGTSAAMELGFAQALGLRVFASEPPKDVVMRDIVEICKSPELAVQFSRQRADAPSRALLALQAYYARAARERGWDGESAATAIALLHEEMAELDAALAGSPGGEENPALELADVLLYVVHLANILGFDLDQAVRDKERINSERFDPTPTRLAA